MRPPRSLALVFVLALLAATRYLAGCTDADAPSAAVPIEAATYVGDEACGQCHEDLYTSYHATGMGRSVSRFDPATAPERFGPSGRSPVVCHDASGYCYEAFVRGDTLFQREFRPDTPGYEQVYAASHVVGSGNATRSYLMTVRAEDEPEGSGYVTEMPLTWYVERALWDLSPGYAQVNDRFQRPIVLHCMTCHNARPGFAEGTQNFYTDVPLGISCERCHGPGSAHIAARSVDEGGDGPDPTIVNPARLDAALQLDVCQQCHLTGHTLFAPGEDPTTYRPGAPLDAHRRVFAIAESVEDPDRFGIASHALRMMQSACFEATQGTGRPLTCTTCHDPHQPTAVMAPDHFNATCRSCHGEATHQAVCERPAADSRAVALTGDCVSCHMTRGGTSDIPHVVFTDHWIRRTIPEGTAPEDIARGGLRTTPFRLVDVTARERALAGADRPARSAAEAALDAALAYWMLYETEHRLPAYLPGIVRDLRRGLAAGADRPEARLVLGRALLEMDSLAAARQALEDAAQRAPDDAQVHYWLGVAQRRWGSSAAALPALERALALQPRLIEARLEYAETLDALGRPAEAVAQYGDALRRAPGLYPEAWNNLGFLHLQQGDLPAATAALRQAIALHPTSVEARANLGAALLGQDDLGGAAEQLEAALRYRPDYVPALGNLGVIRLRQGRRADARRLFEHVLRLRPGDTQAAAYLQQLQGS